MKLSPNTKLWLITIIAWAATIIVFVSCSGCASVVWEDGQHKITRKSWIWADTKVGLFEMVTDTNGTRTIRLKAYDQLNQESIQGIIDAAAAGAAAGIRSYQGR